MLGFIERIKRKFLRNTTPPKSEYTLMYTDDYFKVAVTDGKCLEIGLNFGASDSAVAFSEFIRYAHSALRSEEPQYRELDGILKGSTIQSIEQVDLTSPSKTITISLRFGDKDALKEFHNFVRSYNANIFMPYRMGVIEYVKFPLITDTEIIFTRSYH